MVERVVKATVSRWQPLAIGMALSIGCAALLILRRQRSESRAYEEWWEHRDRVRANGHQSDPQLFV
jgi:hypothetical protein